MTIYKRKSIITDVIVWSGRVLILIILYYLITDIAFLPEIPMIASYLIISIYGLGLIYVLYRKGKWLILFWPDMISPKINSTGTITKLNKIPYLPYREKGHPIEYTITTTNGKKIKFRLYQDWDQDATNQLKLNIKIQLIHSRFLNIPFEIKTVAIS